MKVDDHAPTRNHATRASENELITRTQADAENLINLIAGGCIEQIKDNAAEFGLPKAVITRGVIAILQSQTGGSVHGSRYRMPSL